MQRLTQLRVDQGLSRRQLAIKAGLTPSAVSQVEVRGSASPATLKKIADVLGVRASELMEERR